MGRLIPVIALAMLFTGCQVGAAPTPTPLPSPTPHAPVASAVLQANEVPAPLAACSDSGSIAAYLTSLQASNPSLAQRVSEQWQALKKLGARDAAIALFAADPAACTAELAASGSVKSAASFVAVFGDDGEADRAWQAGVLGFVPPAPGELPPGVDSGASTGLGQSSWTYARPPVQLASWRKSVFVALVVYTNLDAATFAVATAAVDARLT